MTIVFYAWLYEFPLHERFRITERFNKEIFPIKRKCFNILFVKALQENMFQHKLRQSSTAEIRHHNRILLMGIKTGDTILISQTDPDIQIKE